MLCYNGGFLDADELLKLGLKSIGHNVKVHRTAVLIGLENIEFGSNIRVDPFAVISAGGKGYCKIGSHIHIGSHCTIMGGHGIIMDDFAGLSPGVRLFSATDDYGGTGLTNPTIPEKYLCLTFGPIHLCRHVIVGSNTVVLPDVTIGEGSSVGAASIVKTNLEPWGVYAGSPARRIKIRSDALLNLETQYLADIEAAKLEAVKI